MKDRIMNLLREIIAELNEELQYDSLENVNDETTIFGGEEGIDSLSLAFLISQVEIRVDEELNHQIVLADEKAMSMRNSPYRTVGTLTDFILERMGESHV